jgi:hypothetical protein
MGGDGIGAPAMLPPDDAVFAARAAPSSLFFVLHASFASSVRLTGSKRVARSKGCGLLQKRIRVKVQ